MIAIRHSHRFVQCSSHADHPMVRFELSLPAPGYCEADCTLARASLESLGLNLTEIALDVPDTGLRIEARDFVALVVALLRSGGHPVTRAVLEPAVGDRVAVQVHGEELASIERVGEPALDLLNAALAGQSMTSFQTELNRLATELRARAIDPNALLVVQAARQRDLPVMWLDQWPFEEIIPGRTRQFGLYKLGHGRPGRIMAAAMPRPAQESLLELLGDRGRVLEHLSAGGFKVPRFEREAARVQSVGRAARSAARLGFPVRLSGPHRVQFAYRYPSQAAFGPLTDAEQVRQVYDQVAGSAGEAWLEAAVTSERYRCLIIGGRVRAIAACRPPEILGDGRSSVEQLICAAESRGSATGRPLNFHDADVALRLRLAGVTPEQVPEPGWRLALRDEGSLYNGGCWDDVSGRVSETIRGLAVAAARRCGLGHLAGVDLALDDPFGSADAENCLVMDVLPDPDLLGHAGPHAGDLDSRIVEPATRRMAEALLDTLFPNVDDGRVPLVAVTGTNGKTTTVRMLERILSTVHERVACTSSEYAVIGNRLIYDGDSAGTRSALLVLAEDDPDAAVLETARGGLITSGVAFDRCDVGVCLNIGADHLGMNGVETLADLAAVKAEIVRRADRAAVLNADDERVLAMAESTSASEVILVSQRPDSAPLRAFLDQGGRAVTIDTDEGRAWISEYCSGERRPVVAVDDIPATFNGAVTFNVDNACFAVAAARGLGMGIGSIADGLREFEASHDCNPGRFNVFDGLHCQVLIDHAQNVPAMEMLGRAVAALPCSGRRWLLLRALGDRSDAEIQALASAAAGHFDRYVCTNFDLLRGRSVEEVPDLLADALQQAGITENTVARFTDEDKALEWMLEQAGPEDLVVMVYLGDSHRRIWARLESMAREQHQDSRRRSRISRVGHA